MIRERIYAYVLTVDVPDAAPWISPLPALSHARNKILSTLSKHEEPIPIDRLTAKRKKDRLRKEADHAAREKEALDNIQLPAASSCLAILATCRQILLEAFHLWYKHNTLNFRRSEDLYTFLLSIGSVRANEIRSLRLDLPREDWYHPQAKFALGRLLRLENLMIASTRDSHLMAFSSSWVPRLVKDLRGLKDVQVVTSEGRSDMKWEMKGKLMSPRLGTRKAPEMVDLFGRLRMKQNRKRQVVREEQGECDERSIHAPDMADCLDLCSLSGPRSQDEIFSC